MISRPCEACERLVAAIEQVTPLSSALRQAFLTVPRIAFVPRYYERCEQPGEAIRWRLVEADTAAVAQDEALVTQIDPATQMPTSSSSQPSAMALQLEALDLHPGQRVLEIGTGTGYNAALLAHLVEATGQVTTIDIDPLLVLQAQERLAATGLEWITVQCGNGLEGVPSRAPYDRIIATGSFRIVSYAWLEQLVPGGLLIGNLVGNLASVFVRLVKQENNDASGTFLPLMDRRYMELHPAGNQLRHSFPNEGWYQQVPSQTYETPLDMPALLNNPAFLFFLQCVHPDLLRYWRAPQGPKLPLQVCLTNSQNASVLVVQPPQNMHTGPWSLTVYGEQGLWQQVQACHEQWEKVRKPAITDYAVICLDGEQRITLPFAGQSWALVAE